MKRAATILGYDVDGNNYCNLHKLARCRHRMSSSCRTKKKNVLRVDERSNCSRAKDDKAQFRIRGHSTRRGVHGFMMLLAGRAAGRGGASGEGAGRGADGDGISVTSKNP